MEILRVWARQADEAAGFAEIYFPKAEVVIIGHFHHHGIWNKRGKLVINTGAYLNPHHARWVEWRGGVLRCGRVEQGDDFRMAEAERVWRVG